MIDRQLLEAGLPLLVHILCYMSMVGPPGIGAEEVEQQELPTSSGPLPNIEDWYEGRRCCALHLILLLQMQMLLRRIGKNEVL